MKVRTYARGGDAWKCRGANRERGEGQIIGLLCRNKLYNRYNALVLVTKYLKLRNATTTVWLFLNCDIGVLVKLYYWLMHQFWGAYVLISDKIYFSFLIQINCGRRVQKEYLDVHLQENLVGKETSIPGVTVWT